MLRMLFFSLIFVLSGCGENRQLDCNSETSYAKIREVIYQAAQNTIIREFELAQNSADELPDSYLSFTEAEIAVLNVYMPYSLINANAQIISHNIKAKMGSNSTDKLKIRSFVQNMISPSRLQMNFIDTKKMPDIEVQQGGENRTYSNICQTTLSIEPVGLSEGKNLSLTLVYSVSARPTSSHGRIAGPMYYQVHFFEVISSATPLELSQKEKYMLAALGATTTPNAIPKPVSAEVQVLNFVLQGFRVALVQ